MLFEMRTHVRNSNETLRTRCDEDKRAMAKLRSAIADDLLF
jgi:hypothetical protein